MLKSKFFHFLKNNWPIIILLIIAGFLIFKGLDNKSLWKDEGETAVLAKNTLKYGFPNAYDGRYFVVGAGGQHDAKQIGNYWLEAWHPWLQYYLGAAGFFLFGESNFSARLPFALAGLITVWLTYLLAREVFGSKKLGLLTCLLMITSPYILFHFRQVRYYSLGMLFVVLTILFYFRFLKSKNSKSTLFLALSLFFLYLSVDAIALILLLVMFIHYFAIGRKMFQRKIYPKDLTIIILLILSLIPWYLFRYRIKLNPIYMLPENLFYFLLAINNYLFPFILILAIPIIFLFRKKVNFSKEHLSGISFILILLLVGLLSISESPLKPAIRHLTPFAPFILLLLGYLIYCFFKINRLVGLLIIVLLLFTNIFNLPINFLSYKIAPSVIKKNKITEFLDFPLSKTVYLPIWDYLREIHHSEADKTKAFAEYLVKHAKPDDKIFASLNNHVFYFYTNLNFNIEVQYPLLEKFARNYPEPDWILKYESPEIPYEWADENNYNRILLPKAKCFEDFNNSVEFSLKHKDFKKCDFPLPNRYIWQRKDYK